MEISLGKKATKLGVSTAQASLGLIIITHADQSTLVHPSWKFMSVVHGVCSGTQLMSIPRCLLALLGAAAWKCQTQASLRPLGGVPHLIPSPAEGDPKETHVWPTPKTEETHVW